MREKMLNESISETLDALLILNNKEAEKKYRNVIKKLINTDYNLEYMENFDMLINLEIEKILSVVVNEINPAIIDMENIEKLQFLYLKYTFMEQNIEKLIIKKEGNTCCSDKTGHILEAYRKYLLRSIVPEKKGSENYWDVGFGSYEDWFAFCEGLYNLYYGNPEDYILNYEKLLKSEDIF